MGKFSAFLMGGVIGAAVALAFAPRTGEQTRSLVAEKANSLADEAKDFKAGLPESAQDAYKLVRERGGAFLKDAQGRTGDFVANAQARVKEVAGQSGGADPDELREKIEAARKRIAAQVMENAEKAKESAAETTDVSAAPASKAADSAASKAADSAASKPADSAEPKPAAAATAKPAAAAPAAKPASNEAKA